MNNILKEIIEKKKVEIAKAKLKLPFEKLEKLALKKSAGRDFYKAVAKKDGINIIAEIKKASPSLGVIRKDFDHRKLAKEYESYGAAAISVLTETEYFKGSLEYIKEVKAVVKLPVLRKDFLFDPYQLYESKLFGADAVLLIAALLDCSALKELSGLSKTLGLGCLAEVHNEKELNKVLCCSAIDIIGINNRDLKNFKVDKEVSLKLIPKIPAEKTIVIESGISSFDDIKKYRSLGVRAFLIGEALVKSNDMKNKFKELLGTN